MLGKDSSPVLCIGGPGLYSHLIACTSEQDLNIDSVQRKEENVNQHFASYESSLNNTAKVEEPEKFCRIRLTIEH